MKHTNYTKKIRKINNKTMSELNEKSINYGNLNRFLQDLRSHDLSDLEDKIDNIYIPEYTAGTNISISDDNEISCTYSYSLPSDVINLIRETYDELPEKEHYLTFEAIENNTVIKYFKNLSAQDAPIEISKDLITWTTKTASNTDYGLTIATLNTGERLYVRGNNNAYSDGTYHHLFRIYRGSAYLYGNIMSLINKSNFANIYTLSDNAFNNLFYGGGDGLIMNDTHKIILPATSLGMNCYKEMFFNGYGIVSAPDLPATTLAANCYESMFKGCLNIIKAPELPATTLVESCYREMFWHCSSLNFIRCFATDISATNCTYNWVSGVASSGTFIKSPLMLSWTSGNSGTPSNWVIQDYVAPSPIATEDYVNNIAATKANKVDYIIPYVPLQGADWTVLNNVNTNGSYKGILRYSEGGVTLDMGTVDIYVVAAMSGATQQIFMRGTDRIDFTFRVFDGTNWTTTDYKVPNINDTTSSTDNTYSSSKIDSLISALDQRITALGG